MTTGLWPPVFGQALRFFATLFEKWNALSVTHSCTVVFACRTLCVPEGWSRHFSASGVEGRAMHASPFLTATKAMPSGPIRQLWDGRLYEDFYQVRAPQS